MPVSAKASLFGKLWSQGEENRQQSVTAVRTWIIDRSERDVVDSDEND